MKTIDNIQVSINTETVKKKIGIADDSDEFDELEEMTKQALTTAKPKAAYREVFVDKISEDTVVIEKVNFTSKVMRSNLKNAGRVFACVLTCGREIDEWAKGFTDMMDKYLADNIMEIILYKAGEYLFNTISETYGIEKTGWMSPGSLPDWPVNGQSSLFELLGDVENEIGVKLTEKQMLYPIKSVSGILFPSDINYVSCMLCTKKKCGSRRADFDAELYKTKLG